MHLLGLFKRQQQRISYNGHLFIYNKNRTKVHNERPKLYKKIHDKAVKHIKLKNKINMLLLKHTINSFFNFKQLV